MKSKPVLSLLLAAVALSSANATSVAPNPPAPPSGTGISTLSDGHRVQFVSMELLPANSAKGQASSGSIIITARGVSSMHPIAATVNLYYTDYSTPGVPQEVLVQEIQNIPYYQARTPGAPLIFTLSLDDRKIFPQGLKPGSYRAEAVVGRRIMYSTFANNVLPPFDRPISESAGAAMEFYVAELFSSAISNMSGDIVVTPRIIIQNPKMIPQAQAAARQIVGGHVTNIRNWIRSANAPIPGFPRKLDVASKEVTFGTDPKGITFSLKGQVFENAPGTMTNLKGIIAAGNRTFPVPGGLLSLSTKSTLNFSQP